MKRKKLFQTTAILYPDGFLEVYGGAMQYVEKLATGGARAIVVREVRPGDATEAAELRRRLKLARAELMASWQHDSKTTRAKDLLDLRRPLPQTSRGARRPTATRKA